MKTIFFRNSFLFIFLCAFITMPAQPSAKTGKALRENDNLSNHILFPGNSKKTYEPLFNSLSKLVLKGEGTISILQIGDSHIQAGFIPEQMRKNLSSFFSPGCGARGLIFPYRIAKTNNPADYAVKYTGIWENCRNVELKKFCSLGVMGIMSQTHDSVSEITFHFKENATFREFNFIRIYHGPMDTSYQFSFPGLESACKITRNEKNGYTDIKFDQFLKDSLKIRIFRKDTTRKYFTLYGIDFENGDPGIVYSSSGINGAEVTSFLRCDLLKEQVGKMKPDWIIISLGTNDAYPLYFDKAEFIRNYIRLIKEIRAAVPEIAILLTVPGDSFRRHRYDNKNLQEARDAIFEIAQQTQSAVWDFYSIMGGPKSIMNWYKSGLVARDKLHFDKQGYLIQADLLFGAFVDAYISFIDHATTSE